MFVNGRNWYMATIDALLYFMKQFLQFIKDIVKFDFITVSLIRLYKIFFNWVIFIVSKKKNLKNTIVGHKYN